MVSFIQSDFAYDCMQRYGQQQRLKKRKNDINDVCEREKFYCMVSHIAFSFKYIWAEFKMINNNNNHQELIIDFIWKKPKERDKSKSKGAIDWPLLIGA